MSNHFDGQAPILMQIPDLMSLFFDDLMNADDPVSDVLCAGRANGARTGWRRGGTRYAAEKNGLIAPGFEGSCSPPIPQTRVNLPVNFPSQFIPYCGKSPYFGELPYGYQGLSQFEQQTPLTQITVLESPQIHQQYKPQSIAISTDEPVASGLAAPYSFHRPIAQYDQSSPTIIISTRNPQTSQSYPATTVITPSSTTQITDPIYPTRTFQQSSLPLTITTSIPQTQTQETNRDPFLGSISSAASVPNGCLPYSQSPAIVIECTPSSQAQPPCPPPQAQPIIIQQQTQQQPIPPLVPQQQFAVVRQPALRQQQQQQQLPYQLYLPHAAEEKDDDEIVMKASTSRVSYRPKTLREKIGWLR
eukprot:MONOS_16075.1-p1 / transcript=MONOS_16075.1 / gene=MONOS_16075 / organism=Monocercomonoides_exilis_PA203 / gene_product=unspecified product / transcript_product=unspecified product / location=Mono_scaffold01493:1553-2694(+) / protein_length=360 / sequence_SO=supercontig / SO=protein_coding / is_pseudo=false